MAAIELGLPLTAAIPFEGQEKVWPEASQQFYRSVLSCASVIEIISLGRFEPKKFWQRDKWVIDKSEGLLVFWRNYNQDKIEAIDTQTQSFENILVRPNSDGRIKHCLEYAEENDQRIYQLWPIWESWDTEVKFDDFRDTMMDMSQYEI